MYIDAHYDRETDKVLIVGRGKDGRRFYNTVLPDYSFYYEDARGQYTSIHGDNLSKVTVNTFKNFQKEQKMLTGRKLFENDIKPIFKALEANFLDAELPPIHTSGIDIETGFCPKRGFAPTEDPHQPITAITISLDWEDKLITLALRPETVTPEDAEVIASRFENCFMFDDEKELIKTFYEVIEDSDILYGWNSEGYDIPYIVNRTIKILGKDYTRKLCLWNQFPKKREYERYGKSSFTFDISGRVHLDYLQLYRKYTYHEMHSYRLDAIGEYELGENKVQYDGTLDGLYKNDFQKFIEYNRQDVNLLVRLEAKLKFINLTNILAHENCVLLGTTMGAVALTDQAIVLEAHRRKMFVPERKNTHGQPNAGIAGAYVAYPIKGLHSWIASVDINSLYPSAIRALNMSPETLVGQIRQHMTNDRLKALNRANNIEEDDGDEEESTVDTWSGLYACLEYTEVMKQSGVVLTIDVENEDEPVEMTGKELYEWIYNDTSNLCLSANGTIFRTDIDGLIPGLLEKWYADRKEMQKKEKEFEKLISDNHGDKEKLKEFKYWKDYWGQRQLARKINLNALYGAVTNPGSRFCDQRIGQSTTLSGRSISYHMNAKISEILIGEYKNNTEVIAYGDTDSSYFTVETLVDGFKEQGFDLNKDSFVELADSIADQVNDSFIPFITEAFNVSPNRNKLIKCGRELCATSGLFVKKKRYAILYYDKEGFRTDFDGKSGKLKIMGMDTQRADTPKAIQDFLKEVLQKVLEDGTEKEVVEYIREFRTQMKLLLPWKKGTPKRVNNLSTYADKVAAKGKVTVPGHVRASLNWNSLRKMHGDNYAIQIMDGQKVIVCALKPNPLNFKSVALPIDEFNIPDWFKELPFDDALMEEKLIDQKLDNIIGALNWNLGVSKLSTNFTSLFEFE